MGCASRGGDRIDVPKTRNKRGEQHMPREYFKAFHSYLESIEPLNDAERGRLFTALLEYSKTGATNKLNGNERFVFPTLKLHIDIDNKAYEEVIKSRSAAGKKGAAARWSTDGNGQYEDGKNSKCHFDYGKNGQEKEEEKEKEKEEEYNPSISPQGVEDEGKTSKKDSLAKRFEEFWKAYPRKVGKGAAEKLWNRLKPDDALLAKMLQAIEEQKSSSQWQKDNMQFVPHPTTWLNQRRWEDEPAKNKGYVEKDYTADWDSIPYDNTCGKDYEGSFWEDGNDGRSNK